MSGLYYAQARYYDPVSSRMVSEDTHWNPHNMIYGDDLLINEQKDELGLNFQTYVPNISALCQSTNLYAYCGGNPIKHIDLDGEIFMLVTGAIGAVLGGIGGAIYSQVKYGEIRLQNVAAGAAIGGAIGLTGGAAASLAATGGATIFASTATVKAAAVVMAAKAGAVTGTIGKVLYDSWQKCEDAARQIYNGVKHTFSTPLGNRIVDVFNRATGKIHEIKYGYQSLSVHIQTQIDKDLWLLQNDPQVREVIWHFYRSGVSNTGGGSGPLIEALIKAGFKIIYLGNC